MIILSNCLTDMADEGTRNVAVNLVRQLRNRVRTTVVTYDSPSSLSQSHIRVNKLMMNRKLSSLLRSSEEPLLYIPAPAKSRSLAIRLFVLSRSARSGITVIITMPFAMGRFSKMLIKASGAKILTLCERSSKLYADALNMPVNRLRVGVDTERFVPVSEEEKRLLRKEYGIPEGKTVVLHVGHLRAERNIAQMLKLQPEFHGVLVVSTQTAGQQDAKLRRQLLKKDNLTLIDRYIPDIHRIYQMADVYLFPVVQEESCIDSPLSILEAAACGLPVVTTAFAEVQSLLGKEGFYEIASFEQESLNDLLHKAAAEGKNPREAVLTYDWSDGAKTILEI